MDGAKEKLGWEPKVSFEELIKMMVEADIGRLKNEPRAGVAATAST